MGWAGAIGFTTPWLLWGLVLVPALWLLLRFLPPQPVLRRFPGVVLLVGLVDRDHSGARMPLWLLLLRLGLAVLLILGFAGPVLDPRPVPAAAGPLLLVADASWADATDWPDRRAQLQAALAEARHGGRPVAFVRLTDEAAPDLAFTDGQALAPALRAVEPAAWEPSADQMARLAAALPRGRFDSYWLSDGLERTGRGALLAALQTHGMVTVAPPAAPPLALRAPRLTGGGLSVDLLRAGPGAAQSATIIALGPNPSGVEREQARQTVTLTATQLQAEVSFTLPPEVRNRLTRFQIVGEQSAGVVLLADDSLRRRKVALVEGQAPQEGLELLSPGHYLREALRPTADLITAPLADAIRAAPQVILLADVPQLPSREAAALADWVSAGGTLVQFAGPRFAAALHPDAPDDPLLPVRLLPGDRALGGVMSWEKPRALAPFPEGSPFLGLAIPADLRVRAQVLAAPAPDLPDHVIATLADGTPLVTRAVRGKGQVVLFHVTANAEWSDLPLSGLFIEMLDRLAISARSGPEGRADLTGTLWVPDQLLDAYGRTRRAGPQTAVEGPRLARAQASAELPPGLYRFEGAGMALNAVAPDRSLSVADWPASVTIDRGQGRAPRPLGGLVLAVAGELLLLDWLATLVFSGRLRLGSRRGRLAALVLVLAGGLAFAPGPTRAQGAADALARAGQGMALAYVVTGDAAQDELSRAGLWGLSHVLAARTTVEPGDPFAVDLDRDDLSVFSFLYWPVTASQPAPAPEAYEKIARFLASGGMILFDTRDGDLPEGDAGQSERLRSLVAPLDIPPLAQVPKDHVLTRSFYLIDGFPGRHDGPLWVEAPRPDAPQIDGTPFRLLNDGVTPVVIGGNDWASAWAMDAGGVALYPVGRGKSGDRQREMAYRFGVNLIMYLMTGNYKSDQVHMSTLLERLGE